MIDKSRVIGVRSLLRDCTICGWRADYEVTKTNKGLPSKYIQTGERSIGYCKKHLPQEAKDLWNFTIPDIPEQQL